MREKEVPFNGEKRWWNYRSIKEYCQSLNKGIFPVDGYEYLTDEQVKLESIFLGMRTKQGININDIGRDTISLESLSTLQALGILALKNDMVVPTTKGFLVADYIPIYLLDSSPNCAYD